MTNRVAPVSKCLFTVLSHACESTRVEMPDGGPAGTALVFLGTAGENGPVHIRRSTDPDSFFSFSSSWQDKKCGIYSPDIILSLKSPLFGYPTTYSSSVTQNRKRTKGWLSPNRRRSRVTACRSDRHAFETPYVVNSGSPECITVGPTTLWTWWSISRRAHWITASYGGPGFPVVASLLVGGPTRSR